MAESPAAPPRDARPITLRDLAGMEVQRLAGVGPKTLTGLHHLGIESILDLVSHYPRRYLDRTRQATIRDLRAGEEGMVLATVQSIESRRVRGGRSMVMATIGDGTGRLRLSFFNQGWRVKQLPIGTEAVFHGKVDEFRGQRQMTNPVVDLIGTRTGRIIPVYPQSEKANLSTWELGDLVAQALRRCQPRGLAEPLPAWLRDRHGLVDRATALRGIHEPASMAEMAQARRRLVFDELLRIQVALVRAKRELERSALGIEHSADRGLLDRYLGRLPFPLTGAQERAIAEIRSDMTRPLPMHRLLQGDVGAGKTVVAVATLLTAIEGGHQGALMAPTEVLAEQHAIGLRRDLAGLTVADREGGLFPERELRLALLTNRTTGAERTRVLTDLAAGAIDLVVGTHALIQSGVGFRSLGAVVIDEQHRFGVEQRAALRVANEDGRVPDVLVMTATPIPRTAAMTVYGDLDVSVLDELPPGRTPIVTSWARTDAEVDAVWELVRNEVAGGRQAYVVCPLIDESEKLEVASANEVFERLRAVDLAGLSVELLHGRMPSAAKESVMAAFRSGDVDVLVATTVIEVGVDVPNATVMVILDADRFGIAQLHQLRGRVGRGSHASRCVLVGAEPTPDGVARLEALVRSTDGFELAEVDLDLRGEGTIMGERQKGQNDLRLASLRRDREWVAHARDAAFALVDGPGGLDAHPQLVDEVDLVLRDDDQEQLLKG
ncbi:MAG TPA: ATP-dependent DNA helicase RecG [Microthrixaceae bacterium]|nr:ATP-dependent DNA helicase RecG [Microthrixaceae bacterium]